MWRGRRRALLALAALGVLVLATVLGVSQRRAIATWWLLGEIRGAGIEEASLVVEEVSAGGLSLADLRLGAPPALEIARIEARYSPANLWRGYLDELLVSGLRLRASLGEGGLSLGPLDALLAGESAGGGALPAAKIVVAEARADLETPGGVVSLPFQVGIDDAGEGRLEAEASFEVHHPVARGSGRASIAGTPSEFEGTLRIAGSLLETPDLRVDSVLQADASFRLREQRLEVLVEVHPVPVRVTSRLLRAEGETPGVRLQLRSPGDGAGFGLDLETRGGRVALPDYQLSVAEIDLSAHLEGRRGGGRLRVGELRDLREPARVEPLGLHGSFESQGSAVEFQLKLADAGERLVLDARGSADPIAPSVRAELHLHPIAFEQGGLQPAAIFPLLEGRLEAARGHIEAVGTAAWDGVRATGEIDLALRDVDFETGLARVSGVNGRVEISGPFPPATPPGQLISIALIDAGLLLTDGIIEFQLRPDGLLDLTRAEWQSAGGVVWTAEVLDPTADSQQAVLEVEGVELAELLDLVDLEGLEGSGVLEGEIPILRRGEVLELRGAVLRGTGEGGRIRYRPDSGVEALAAQGQGLGQLLGALENFQYDFLELTLDGDTQGEVDLAIHLRGFNPNFEAGRRVEFNLNVESRLADLVRAGLAAYRVPEVIEQRLEEFQAPEVP